ncbi:MAG: hypothetical protein KC503_32330 [Myxococcales bacterium]|nr:hypothetical protein [Myxococcales bacterium]
MRPALPLLLALCCALAGGCKGFQPLSDAALADADARAGDGADASDGPVAPPQCTSTSVRAFQPLGNASVDSLRAALVSVGDNVAMVWEDVTSGGQGTLYYAEVARKGSVVAGPTQLAAGTYPHILTVQGKRLLFYRDAQDRLVMRELGDAGKLVGSKTVTNGLDGGFDIAFDGDGFVIAATLKNNDNAAMVFFLRTDQSGEGQIPLSVVPAVDFNALQPTLAPLGKGRTLVAWTDARASPPLVYARIIGDDGKALGNETQVSASSVRGSFASAAALLGGGAMLCYQQRETPTNQEVYCSRLDDQGAVTATNRLTNTIYDSINPRVVAQGAGAWVVWNDYEGTATEPTIHWQFLDRTGAPLLATPYASSILGWRPHPLVRADALFLTQYTAETTSSWKATSAVVNCF